MSGIDLVGEDLPLERQNEKLRRIVAALMRRVERDVDESGNAFTLFQRAIALEAEVAARTADLQRALTELNEVNTQLEAASKAAEEANRAKSRFLAAASHDLLQPLNAAKLFIGSLGERPLDEDSRRILDRLSSAFRSVEEILGALLDISRLDSEATRANIAAFPVARIFEPIANEFQHLAHASGSEFRIMPCSAWVQSDPFYLRQIVQNLVSNAVRYCRGGRVLIGARRVAGGCLRIEVHDTGPGIPEDQVPHVFGEFRRLDTPAEPGVQQGVGLGLAIVERACRLLDHSLDLRSIPGRGTRFAVTVPLAAPERQGSDGRAAVESDETMIAVFLSPNPALAELIAGLLESWGMAALTAATPEEVLEQVEHLGMLPDVLVVDDEAGDGALTEAMVAALRPASADRPRVVRLADPDGPPARSLPPGVRTLVKPVRPHQLRAVLG